MARSAFVEVNITNSTRLAQDSQNTADKAAGGVTNLNDPNLMSVIEKQNNVVQFAGLTSQYNVLIQNAKDEGIDTNAVTTAYNNLNKFMADVLADPEHASDVDRAIYKKYQDTYNEELANLQSALQNSTNNKFTSATNATSQAASTANVAKSAADSAYSYANSEMAVQSNATAKAQSTADSAFSQAVKAIDTGQATSQAVTDLKGGSKLTIAELQNGLATKVANSDYASYKDQTASQIGQMVTDGAFSAYQQTTKDLISSKVATSDFSAYQATTAKSIDSKVESSDFNTYKTQTDSAISSKVSSTDFNNLTISNRNLALGTATAFKMTGNGAGNQGQTSYGFSKVISQGTVVTIAFDISSTDGAGTFAVQFNGYDSGSSWQYISGGDLIKGTKHVSVTLTTEANHAHVYFRLDNATGTVTISNFIISESSKEVSWTPAPEDQATESQFTQLSDDMDLRVKKGDLIGEINLQAGNTLISSGGQLTLSGKTIYFDSNNPVIIPSANIDKLLVDKKLTAADISAKTFTTNNGTFTVDQNGSVTATRLSIIGNKNFVYNSELLGNATGWDLTNGGHVVNNSAHAGTLGLNWNSTTNGANWVQSARSKLMPVNYSDDRAFSASAWLLVRQATKGTVFNLALRFWDSSLKQVGADGTNYTSDGNYHDWSLVTVENLAMPSTASYVSIDYNAYNGSGDFTFSQPMINQGSKYQGYTSDTGNVVSTGTVIGTNISGSVIGGTTFHGGDIISDSNNTSSFYPFTIESTGKASTTLFNSMDALRTEMSGGGITTKYRAVNSTDTEYEAYDGIFTGNLISLNSGFTNGKDMSFSQSVSGNQLNGQVIISPLDGLTLHGDTQRIYFNGMSTDTTPKGIAFTPYGNINATGTQATWYVGHDSSSLTAVFGIDGAGNNKINFSRDTYIGNLLLGAGHTIAMVDGMSLYFKKGSQTGAMLEIHAGDIHYTSLVKSSLLSVKRDVQKADTAYWAQLVNSIDLATYQYKSDDNTSHLRLSSIVDDVNVTKQWKLPDVFISRDENGKLNGVDDSVLLNATLATVQEQQKEIDQLNGHNMELEARLNKLEAKLNG